MTITAPVAPTLPSLNDPANFNTRALALFSWLVTEYIPWLETLAGVTEDGEINGTPIGQKVAAAGKFTTLLADSIGGAAVQSGAMDNTDGKIWKTSSTKGAFGLGAIHAPNCDDADLLTVSGLYRTVNDTVNTPVSSWGHTILHQQFDQNNATQLFASNSSDKLFFRRKRSGVWQAWVAIVGERGSNANGDYVRFADGTQICTANITGMDSTSSVAGGLFRSSPFDWTFPAAFVQGTENGPTVFGDVLGGAGLMVNSPYGGRTTVADDMRIYTIASVTGVGAHLMAVGRWF